MHNFVKTWSISIILAAGHKMVSRSLVHLRIENPVKELKIDIIRSLLELKKSHNVFYKYE